MTLPDESLPEGAKAALGQAPLPSPTREPSSLTSSTSGAPALDEAAGGGTREKRPKRARPGSILEFVQFAYNERGRKIPFSKKDLDGITEDAANFRAETDEVRRLAADDHLLAVPPAILSFLAETKLESAVRRRLLELAFVAMASHPVFEGHLAQLRDPNELPSLTARVVGAAARAHDLSRLPDQEPGKAAGADSDRLAGNAVSAFLLLRVLRDRWSIEDFVLGMAQEVWSDPRERNVYRTAAVLAQARSHMAMSQLARQYEALLEVEAKATEDQRVRAAQQHRRADSAEQRLSEALADAERLSTHVEELEQRLAYLAATLDDERKNRVVDSSHLLDDYETLRTQVIRRLAAQTELLSDGLHALRSGSTAVAEEFLDRALTAIQREVVRLRSEGERG